MANGTDHPQNSFSGKGVFPARYAFTLLIPLRNLFLSPGKLIKRLALKEDFTVLEIGPGPGYFSPHIAKVLSRGKLVLTDIQQEMLAYAKRRLDKRRISNVEYRLGNGKTLDFENASFDRVFMVTVIGEVENKQSYLREIHRILKNDGILSISELAGDPDKLSREALETLVCPEGFKVRARFGSAGNYTTNFEKV
jgi:ubiquinone/menaquinone biosynthesis C-methylase UbiE